MFETRHKDQNRTRFLEPTLRLKASQPFNVLSLASGGYLENRIVLDTATKPGQTIRINNTITAGRER